jgi:uncharacterized protein (DUF362 family)
MKHKSIVSVVQVTRSLNDAVNKMLYLSDFQVPSHSDIVIKINLCALRTFETGATTDPRILKALINVLKDNYDVKTITVVESDSTAHDANLLFYLLGFKELSEKLGFQFVNLSCDTFIKKQINGYRFKEVRVPSVIANADYFITLAKLKTHGDVGISCALKNQFGCYPYPRKIEYHKFLIDAIVDANLAMKPDFAIIDGVISMIGSGGPTFGLPFKSNILISSKDIVAADTVCAKILGFNPTKLSLIRKAATKKIGNMNYTLRLAGLKSLPLLGEEDYFDRFILRSLVPLFKLKITRRILGFYVKLLSK